MYGMSMSYEIMHLSIQLHFISKLSVKWVYEIGVRHLGLMEPVCMIVP